MLHGLEKELAQNLVIEFKDKVSYIIADLADQKCYQEIINTTVKTFGGLHCLVNTL